MKRWRYFTIAFFAVAFVLATASRAFALTSLQACAQNPACAAQIGIAAKSASSAGNTLGIVGAATGAAAGGIFFHNLTAPETGALANLFPDAPTSDPAPNTDLNPVGGQRIRFIGNGGVTVNEAVLSYSGIEVDPAVADGTWYRITVQRCDGSGAIASLGRWPGGAPSYGAIGFTVLEPSEACFPVALQDPPTPQELLDAIGAPSETIFPQSTPGNPNERKFPPVFLPDGGIEIDTDTSGVPVVNPIPPGEYQPGDDAGSDPNAVPSDSPSAFDSSTPDGQPDPSDVAPSSEGSPDSRDFCQGVHKPDIGGYAWCRLSGRFPFDIVGSMPAAGVEPPCPSYSFFNQSMEFCFINYLLGGMRWVVWIASFIFMLFTL